MTAPRAALVVLALAACDAREREVAIQLGPTSDTLTQGFLCRADDGSGLLVSRARDPDGIFRVRIVVDLIGFGGRLPGCRGEELLQACSGGPCEVLPAPTRYCAELELPAGVVMGDRAALLAEVRAQLATQAPVTLDAPAAPVMIRVVATHQPCDAIATSFAPNELVGCAHSCPVQLDGADGPIAVSLDTLSDRCEQAVLACARFPE